MQILNLFIDHAKLSLPEIVKISGLPKTSAHRMLQSLDEMGFLSKDIEGRYELGLIFLQFGHLVSERLDIRNIALPIMRSLKDELGEAVNLVVLDGDEALYIEKVDTTERVRVYTQIGRRAPLYGGACPRILLAHMTIKQQEEYLEKVELIPYAANTITDKQVLHKVLVECKEKGYSISHSELENYSSAVGAPIFDHTGTIVAGISVVGPEYRFHEEKQLQRYIDRVKDAAKEISYQLGWNMNGGE
ncbi:IclR family transcriptional regulator [Peribacillus alkalitolerans]|uniref:IclR family transcriptional regulator n=1 Tax=Peribacillus alkalitolerans TaxID=1550385 RepID=UPI0013D38139